MILTQPQTQATPAVTGARVLTRGQARQQYTLRLAQGPADIRAAQALRFQVFNLELQEGLEQSFATRLDADPFDEVCDHLLVEDRETGAVVGTYRLQSGMVAASRLGYYSAQEFDLAPFEPYRAQIVELGRACVHRQHRNLAVLGQLWKGIHTYARERGLRHLIGCSSLTTQDPAVGATMYAAFYRRHLAPPAWRTQPLPGCVCSLDALREETPKVPKLLAAYLSLGARICGPPALDREFKTVDFLTWLDLDSLPAAAVQRLMS